MAEVRPRIIGSETEVPISVRDIDRDHHVPLDGVIDIAASMAEIDVAVSWGMLSNGSRFYRDGGIYEYATPETTSFRDMVAREFAGELIVMTALNHHVRAKKGAITSAYIRKRVRDDQGLTCGYHLNLSANRFPHLGRIDDASSQLLALHLATSQPYFGAGAIYRDQSGRMRYSFGQKVLSLSLDYDSSTNQTGKKPLINTRDEPLVLTNAVRRMHFTSVDAHISPWATQMLPGTLSLVLRAIEQGKGNELRVERSDDAALVWFAKRCSLDPKHNQLIRRDSTGRTISANDIQEELLRLVESTERTNEEEYIYAEWQRAYSDFLIDQQRLNDRSDAILRRTQIWNCNERRGERSDDYATQTAQLVDHNYDTIYRIGDKHTLVDDRDIRRAYEKTRPARIRSGNMAQYMPDQVNIDDAITIPPTDTRAFKRGNVIKQGGLKGVTWDSFNPEEGREERLDNPWSPDGKVAVDE